MKKPFLQRKWVWVVIVIIIGIGYSEVKSSFRAKQKEANAEKTLKDNDNVPASSYIPKGDVVITPSRTSDSSPNKDSSTTSNSTSETSSLENTSNNTDVTKKVDDSIEEREKNTFSNGDFIVGQDIPPGEYVFIVGNEPFSEANKDHFKGSIRIYSDSSSREYKNQLDDAVINKEVQQIKQKKNAPLKNTDITEYGSQLFELQEGQLVHLDNASLYPVEYRIVPDSQNLIPGMYKIGRDIAPGKYQIKDLKLTGENLHPIRILKNVIPGTNITENTIDSYQDYSEKTAPDSIVLNDGDYIYFSGLVFSKID